MEDPPKHRSRNADLFCRTLILLAFLCLLVGYITAIVVLEFLCPKPLPKFSFDTISVSNLNVSSLPSPSISGDWSINFSVINPNKKNSVSYYEFSAQLLYGGDLVSTTRLQPFDQAKNDRTAFIAKLSARDTYVEERVVSGISVDVAKGHSEGFKIRILAKVEFRGGMWLDRQRELDVVCEDLGFEFSESNVGIFGKLVGGPKECSVFCLPSGK